MTKLLLLISVCCLIHTTSFPQGKWSMGFTMASRSEWRQYQDSYQYLFKGSGQGFSFGGSLAYQHNEKWRWETGLFSTPYSNTVGVYYNEPGYRRMLNRPVMYVSHTNTLEIPLKAIYSTPLKWRNIQINVVAGFNTYLLAENINSQGYAGLPAIPVSPAPPTNLSVVYNDRNLSKVNFSLEAGGEAFWKLSERFHFIYRLSGRVGFIEMVEMQGDYRTGDNLTLSPDKIYPFRVVSRGSALHHTFSLRFVMGRKKWKENWWEDEY
ncbi:hypothetical protein KUV23_00470 [Algoriphagus marincola]|uniref:Outer membrane protein beta-barrel domain-containing protein n=1 Tax=Algoriphagus marincola TaxID=264027 RepID=A0ABS7MZD2_9BACT|nr:hypothetical protein [Algoriphagus marincola]MBY5949421.1 hypothetical protein [Algoriphagus marincola]